MMPEDLEGPSRSLLLFETFLPPISLEI